MYEDARVDKSTMEAFNDFAKRSAAKRIDKALDTMATTVANYNKQLKKNGVPYSIRKYLLTSFQTQIIALSLQQTDK